MATTTDYVSWEKVSKPDARVQKMLHQFDKSVIMIARNGESFHYTLWSLLPRKRKLPFGK